MSWRELPDALVPDDDPLAFDHVATWSGSVIADPDHGWRMFYTGRSAREPVLRQRIGSVVSDDLLVWRREGDAPLEADPRWYEQVGDSTWGDEAWRDPWVLADPATGGWHMLVTARGQHAAVDDRGVVGHAVSADLRGWTVAEPGPPRAPASPSLRSRRWCRWTDAGC